MSDALKPQLHGRDHRPGGRDPIPVGVAEYGLFVASNVSLGTSLTQVPWTDNGGNNTTGTFTVSSGNVVIEREGYYRVGIYASGWTLTGSVNSVLITEVMRLSGATGVTASQNFSTGDVTYELLHYDSQNANEFDFTTNQLPGRDFDLMINQASIDGAGAGLTLRVRAYVEEDLAGVAHSESDWSMMIVRVGSVHNG